MNAGIESQLNEELNEELVRILKFAYPLPRSKKSKADLELKSSYKSIVHGEQQLLLDIIRQARQLSFTIQHDIISCQLLVTVRQPSSDGDVLGTNAFGLHRITGSESTVLVKTEIITNAELQSLLL